MKGGAGKRLAFFVHGVLTITVLLYISYILYIFRYSVLCGKGVGIYAVIGYVPFALISIFLVGYSRKISKPLLRRMEVGALVVGNAAFLAVIILYGTCFSCVNQCVEEFISQVPPFTDRR